MARLTPAVVRTLDILELFLTDDRSLSAPSVVRLTGFPRTSVHELLSTLHARDYLQKSEDDNTYRLGIRLLHLGNAYSARFDILKSANDMARELASSTGETVSVAVLEGADVFYLAKIEGRDNLRLPSSIGQRIPATVTALGKVMLAYESRESVRGRIADPAQLPKLTEHSIGTLAVLERELETVRARGIAFEREESTLGVRCAAAPVRNATGSVIAAISMSLPLSRWEQYDDTHWAELVRQGADRFSEQLGFSL